MRILDFSNWKMKTVGVRDVGPFEPPFEKALCEIKEGWNCMDVGAAIGYYAMRIGHLAGEKGRIWAIEPHRLICAVPRRNI